MNLNNKIALVTGGTQGIGRAICLKLASLGATVIVNGVHNEQKAQEVSLECGSGSYYMADISDFEATKKMINDVVKQYDKIDILVCNAGLTKDNLALRMKEEDFDKVIDVNLKGTWNCMKHACKPMIKNRQGKIVTIASVVGVMGNAGQTNYAASKGGIIAMTKSFARELAGANVNVNAIAPGFVQTNMTDVLDDKIKEQIQTQIPLKRMAKPEEIADVVAFLCCDEAKYMTGQTLCVDGGMIM